LPSLRNSPSLMRILLLFYHML